MPVPPPAHASTPTSLLLPTFIRIPALQIDCPILYPQSFIQTLAPRIDYPSFRSQSSYQIPQSRIGRPIFCPQSPIPPPPPPPPAPLARRPPNQLEPARALDKGKRKTNTALAPPLAQRPPKRIKPTLVADNKEKGKVLVEKRKGKTTEAPILPLILLSRKQYVNFKRLVGQSVGLKKIPHWTNNLRDGSDWDRREFRCLRRNAFSHNTRVWAGWKRNHMALLALGIKAAYRRGRRMELDAFIIEYITPSYSYLPIIF